MRINFLLICLLLSCPASLNARYTDSLYVQSPETAIFKDIVPGLAGLAITSLLIDEPVNNFARDSRSHTLNRLSDLTDMGGEKKIVVPGLLLTYGAARFVFKDEKLQTASVNAIQSVIVTALVTEGIKYLGGRARPFTDEGPWSFNPLPGNIDHYKSMPSGHASLAFALFTPFAETYSRWLYIIPAAVSWGRVYQDKHWLSDVVVGSGIGLISGYLFTHHENIHIIPTGILIDF